MPDIARASSARCCEASERVCSEFVRVLSNMNLAWPDVFMSSGLLAITTAPICGVASSCGALGGRSGLLEWATRHRRAETSDAQSLKRVPSARSIARLVSHRRDAVSSFADAVTKLRPLSGLRLQRLVQRADPTAIKGQSSSSSNVRCTGAPNLTLLSPNAIADFGTEGLI